jgi:hypothetical protein
LTLHWNGPSQTHDRATWRFEPAETGVSKAVIDAGAYRANPFFLIPIYHVYQDRTPGPGLLNLRAVASSPMRVEVYDEDRELIAVDAQGDGKLDGSGDSLVKDQDHNGIADLALPPGRNEVSFLLMVRPLDGQGGEDVKLQIESFQNGTWQLMAVDTIRPTEP